MSAAELLPAEPASDPGTTIAEYTVTAQALAVLRHRMEGVVYDVSTTKGLEAARKDRAEIRGYRVALENKRVEIKAPALKRAREIDSEATRIRLELEKLEAIPDAAIKAEEARKERERQEKIAAEAARVNAIQDDIEKDLRCVPLAMVGHSPADLATAIRDVEAIEITPQRFAEFVSLALSVKTSTLDKLREMHTRYVAHESEQERLRLEREEFARLRAAQEEANRKERERIAAEEVAAKAALEKQRQEQEAAAKAKRDADAAEDKRQREAAEAESAERMRKINEESERLRAEREENERAAKEERERLQAEQQRLDAARAELERKQQAAAPAIVEVTAPESPPAEQRQPDYSTACPVLSDIAVANDQAREWINRICPPNADEIANLVAGHYGVDIQKAFAWCKAAFDSLG